jgi:hypothetical protein
MRRLLAGLTTAIFLTAGLSFAGTVTSYVTSSGNATNEWIHSWGNGNYTYWNGLTLGNDAAHGYSLYCSGSCSGDETRTYTWLQAALPSLSGNIISAVLYIDVLGYSTDDGSGIYGALYDTLDASSANGNASQELNGDQFVTNLAPTGTGLLGLNVTSFVQSDYSSHYSWAAFEFSPTAQNPYNSDFSFGTAMPQTVAGDAPYLVITTDAGNDPSVPEPAMLSLAGLALLAFGLVSRRRKI